MKVLFVTHVNNMGGANRAMLYLILELKKLGVEVEVILPKTIQQPKHSLIKELKHFSVPYFENFYFFYRINSFNRLVRYCSNIFWYSKILWKLQKHKYDIIHSNSSFTDLGVWIGLVKGVPHVWHLREYGNWGKSRPALGKLFDKFLINRTEVGIAISKAVGTYYKSIFPINRLCVIYDGVEPRTIKRHNEISSNSYNFCMIGNLCEGKNQIMAIEAAGILSSERRDFQLYFIGSGNEYEKHLRIKAKELNIDSNVKFIGEVDDVDYWLDQMQCGLMLTNNEAFGRVTIEYMIHELPVIATDSGANAEIVINGKTGVIISQHDISALVYYMKYVMENRQLTEIWGKEGRRRAIQEFSSNSNALSVKSLYDTLTCKCSSVK